MQQLRHVRILIIDDDEDIRWSLREIFETTPRFECEIYEAENARSGVKILQKEYPDIVLLDVRLPDADGIKLLKAILKKRESASIIMISGIDEAELLKKTKLFGAKEFIAKPFDYRIVLNVLAKVLDTTPRYMDI